MRSPPASGRGGPREGAAVTSPAPALGNPSVNDSKDFVPLLKRAKDMGLWLAIHLAEIDRPEDTAALMALPPDRIGRARTAQAGGRGGGQSCSFSFPLAQRHSRGPTSRNLTLVATGHGTFLDYESMTEAERSIPIEVGWAGAPAGGMMRRGPDASGGRGSGACRPTTGAPFFAHALVFSHTACALLPTSATSPYVRVCQLCLTSNVKANMVPRLDDHHILDIRRHGSPFVLCTDDKGVFETSLSYEYEQAASLLGLTRSDLERLAVTALDYIFLPPAERPALRARWFQDLPPWPTRDLEM